jgi:hypothetical protein
MSKKPTAIRPGSYTAFIANAGRPLATTPASAGIIDFPNVDMSEESDKYFGILESAHAALSQHIGDLPDEVYDENGNVVDFTVRKGSLLASIGGIPHDMSVMERKLKIHKPESPRYNIAEQLKYARELEIMNLRQQGTQTIAKTQLRQHGTQTNAEKLPVFEKSVEELSRKRPEKVAETIPVAAKPQKTAPTYDLVSIVLRLHAFRYRKVQELNDMKEITHVSKRIRENFRPLRKFVEEVELSDKEEEDQVDANINGLSASLDELIPMRKKQRAAPQK